MREVGLCGWGIPENQSVLGRGLEKYTCKQDTSAVTSLHSTRGHSGQFLQERSAVQGAGTREPSSP